MITVLLLIKKFYEFIRKSIMILLNRVHKELGPGLLESVYQLCMVIQLQKMGVKFQSELSAPCPPDGRRV